MLFETLESRQLLTYMPGEIPTLDVAFLGNNVPDREVRVASAGSYLTAPSTANPTTIGLNYLTANASAYGLTAADFSKSIITNSYTSDGVTHVYLQQTFNGLPIADSHASVHVNSNGRVISADANFIPGLPHPAVITPALPDITADMALHYYASIVNTPMGQPLTMTQSATGPSQHTVFNAPDLSDDPINVRLQYAYRGNGQITLGWRINVATPDGKHHWDMTISADLMDNVGQVIQLTDWVWNASYQVFARPTQDPFFGPRTIAVDPHDANGGSPFGWHDANGVAGPEFLDTRGNNVSAQDDLDGDDAGGTRPASATLNFTAPLVLPAAPATYLDASIINAFYWANLAHDVTFAHGFNEVSGNFQLTNFTGQGLGNDWVELDVQDATTVFNATMATPPDGFSPRLSMGLFPLPLPGTDSSLDGTIVVHEYGHGVSNRLTGGPANANALNALQSAGMGEGWSDWLGILMTAKASDTRDTPRTLGDWVLNAPGVGVRRYPYSYDMSIDPLTLGDYNGDTFPQQNGTEVHNSGEIWASALWDLTRLLIDKHGYNDNLYDSFGGMQVALDIVMGGMKLQPANPTFIEARDAILAADLALYGGDNTDEIWEAFARRGFGVSASAGNGPNSLVVVEAFDRPAPLARITGVVFQDTNGNVRRDNADFPLQGWTVYVDSNNNSQFDTGEKNTVTAADGSYSLSFFNSGGSARIRQVVQPGFTQILPGNNGGYVVSIPGRGQVAGGVDFGNLGSPGSISGIKWNDLDADGVRDLDDPATFGINEFEPGIQGVVIYVDLNNDRRLGILEPADVTDFFGRYTISNLQPGTYTVRELNAPGYVQTFPSPLNPTRGEHVGVLVGLGGATTDINFGNTAAVDWGDAPSSADTGFASSYPTTLAQNGARHGILPGFGLGPVADGEADGQPLLNALGDDSTGSDDEDGVLIPGLTPGATVNALVQVQTGGFSGGLLQGWIDWNRDGDWDDAGEQVVTNRLLRQQALPHLVSITVPADAPLGPTYARFRYGYETNLGPTGPATAGEVEDHLVVVLDDNPVAIPDCFGGGGTIPGCVPIIIQQGSAGTALDVLANDFGTANGGPFLIPSDFPTFTTGGGVVNFSAGQLIYTPDPNFIGQDTFLYRIQDGAFPPNVSSPAPNTLVTVHVTAGDPVAIDDTRSVAFVAAPTIQRLPGPDLLANDISPDPVNTRIVPGTVTRITPGPAPVGELLQISADGKTFDFRPATGFRGTVIYEYQINDTDVLTDPSTARVTIQVVDFVAGVPQPAPSHWAQFEIQYLSLAGTPIVGVVPGDEFIVRVVATDVGPNNLDTDPNPPAFANRTLRGVEAAFLDLLYDRNLATPVASADNPLDMFITFDGKNLSEASGGTVIVPLATVQAGATAVSFSGAAGELDPADNFYNGAMVVFTSGTLTGQRARITDYVGATRTLQFETGSFTQAPAQGNTFRIEFSLYNQNQTGAVNTPAPGAIDEVGGVHVDANAPIFFTGTGANTVFSVRFRANNPGSFSAVGDPAERLLTDGINPPVDHRVFLVNSPNPQPNELVPLTDEQVFFRSPAPLLIAAPGAEAEFSNFRNPLDVNDDTHVSPSDALTVINTLNAGGSRQVSQYSMATSGQLAGGYVDVNSDGFVAPIDALLVINALNAGSSQSFVPSGEGESAAPAADEGEGESAALYGAGGAAAALAFSVPENLPEGEIGFDDLCDLPLPNIVHEIIGELTGHIADLTDHLQDLTQSIGQHGIDADEVVDLVRDAVDELLARLDCDDLFDLHPFRNVS